MIWKNAIQSYQEVLFREQECLKLRYRVSNKKNSAALERRAFPLQKLHIIVHKAAKVLATDKTTEL